MNPEAENELASNQDELVRKLTVEVAYATPQCQLIVKLEIKPGMTVAQVIEMSALRKQFPEIEAQPIVGIFSRKVPLNHVLASGDRVEIYRPLVADPKDARRHRVEQERVERDKAEREKAGRKKQH